MRLDKFLGAHPIVRQILRAWTALENYQCGISAPQYGFPNVGKCPRSSGALISGQWVLMVSRLRLSWCSVGAKLIRLPRPVGPEGMRQLSQPATEQNLTIRHLQGADAGLRYRKTCSY